MASGHLLVCVGLVAALVLLLWLTVREVLAYRRGVRPISRRQLVWRLLCAGLLAGLLVRVLVGSFFYLSPDDGSIRHVVTYWSKCAGLGYLVSVMAILDLSMVVRGRRRQRALWRQTGAAGDQTGAAGGS